MIRFIEELSINALPSIDTLFYDGWLLRFSCGYTKRGNSVYPLFPSELDLDNKIAHCENLYHSKNLPIIFKITNASYPSNIDSVLEKRGYAFIDPTLVHTLNLNNALPPKNRNILIFSTPTDQWIIHYCMLNNIKYQHMSTLQLMLKNIIPEKYFITLMKDDKPIACGLGVIENDYIGLYNIIVDKELRGKGYGEQLLLNLLDIGKNKGAKFAYLQVHINNIPALHLYRKLGFKEYYKYWYRAKLQ